MIKILTKSKSHLHVFCSSEFDHLEQIVNESETFLLSLLEDDDLTYKVVLLLTEAVTNAIEHGNAHDASKHVRLDLKIDVREISIQVEDEGEGFDREKLKNPTDEENLLMDGGRGIFFIEQIADDVRYDLKGRRVHITFKR